MTELNKLTSLPMCGFIAQLVEHHTGIAEVTGSNPVEALGPVPERRNNSIPGINVPYFSDSFILGINYVPERRHDAIKRINLGLIYYTLQGGNKSLL